ncbi:MAG: hypothetical protein JW731_06665, partial [Bacteroidales bacterium]|nr:hypothetical protein [Bacteroidales bacterium]
MKKVVKLLSLVLVLSVFLGQAGYAQNILKKLKNKTEDKVIDKVFDDNTQSQDNTYEQPSSGSDRPSNTRGGGLENTKPDVGQNIKNAEASFGDKKYGDARYAVRQAIMGIELEIGENILKDLPASLEELPKNEEEDMVTSSGIGFVGLIIERTYRKDDKQMKVTIGNDAGMLSAVNMYLAAGGYAQSSSEQNYKQTTFKDHRAVIEYDENSGYKLSVPFGQSSILVTEGVNYESEDDFMNASNEINIDNIKKQLGEQ